MPYHRKYCSSRRIEEDRCKGQWRTVDKMMGSISSSCLRLMSVPRMPYQRKYCSRFEVEKVYGRFDCQWRTVDKELCSISSSLRPSSVPRMP
jgi:hypothetical protein